MKSLYHTLPDGVIDRHIKSVIEHRTAVMQAGLKIGVPINLLEEHDLSKFHHTEFVGYALRFHGQGLLPESVIDQKFREAWLHHVHLNKHHWQHWIMPYDMDDRWPLSGAIEMPHDYVLEMIADWMGASYTYGRKTWDISAWLRVSARTIILHPSTRSLLRERLADLGYEDLLGEIKFYGE